MHTILPRWWNPSWPGNRLQATSWLDGLRGYAALCVLNQHRFPMKARFKVHYYPFINCFFAGAPAVDLFFVISGYVIAQHMIQQLRSRQKEKVLDSLSSAILRRWVRLFAPSCIITFLAMLLVFCGVMKGPRYTTLTAQVYHWAWEFVRFSDPLVPIVGWNDPKVTVNMSYFDYMWTIAVEFRGSILVYLFIAATSKLRSSHRLSLGVCLIISFFSLQNTYGALFLSGTCLAEISLVRFPGRYALTCLPTTEDRKHDPSEETRKKHSVCGPSFWMCILYTTALVFALFASGCNGHFQSKHPVYEIFRPLTPLGTWSPYALRHYWPSMSAVLLVWTIDSWELLQRPLVCRFSQVLGKLSFGTYLMQKLVLATLYNHALAPLLQHGVFHGHLWWPGAFCITMINYFAVAWAADLFDRFDARIITWSRTLQQRITEDW